MFDAPTGETPADRVAELPDGARLLARNDYEIQVFHLDSTYGVQFHAEYDRDTAEWVIDSKDLHGSELRRARNSVSDEVVEVAATAGRVIENFDNVTTSNVNRYSLPGGGEATPNAMVTEATGETGRGRCWTTDLPRRQRFSATRASSRI